MVNADRTQDPPVLLQMRGIVKQFPGARALDGVDLEIRAGEVHCLLGQNGAGKSTLIKVLAGAHQPTEGEILVDGTPVTITDPVAGLKLGIATMYQELDVVDGLTVAENIFLGHENAVGGVLRRRATAQETRALLERLGHPLLAELRSVVYRRSLPLATGNLPIVLSELGSQAGVVGAARMISDSVLSHD